MAIPYLRRHSPAVVLLAGLLLIAASSIYVGSNLGTTSGDGTAILSASRATNSPSCGTSDSNGLQLQYENEGYLCKRLFLLQPGSTATLTVSYRVVSSTGIGPAVPRNFSADVWVVHATSLGNGYEYSYDHANGVTTSASPRSITVTGSTHPNNVTVIYTINTESYVRGFFALSYTDNCPTLIPLSVGYSASQVGVFDFPGFFVESSCTLSEPLAGSAVVSVSNMQIEWLQSPTVSATAISSTASLSSQSGLTSILVNSTAGLQLGLSVNGTLVKGGLVIRTFESNGLHRMNNITASGDWSSPNLGAGFGPCAFENQALRVSVFEGYYTTTNLSEASPLQLVNPSAVFLCPAVFDINYYLFQPASQVAQVGECLGSPCVIRANPMRIALSLAINGTWSGVGKTPAFQAFLPGVYTVAAGDEWGALAVLHFRVSGPVSGGQGTSTNASISMNTETSYGSSAIYCNGNCSINPPWRLYQTLHDLKEASPFVVVANVTAASTVDINGIPVTVYQLSIITNIEGPGPNRTAGMTTLPMAQIGGTANGTTVSIEGYPTLPVGGTYVLFLNGPGSLLPSYYGSYLTSVGGPQGTFLVQSGKVFSLDKLYPQADTWLPVKADGIALSQFIVEVQTA